jgi:hypothetical protein
MIAYIPAILTEIIPWRISSSELILLSMLSDLPSRKTKKKHWLF